MNITIHKQTLDLSKIKSDNDGGAYIEIEVAREAEYLTVQIQHQQPQLWYKTPLFQKTNLVRRRVYVCGTGHTLAYFAGRYIGTVQLSGGSLVLHFFAEK